MEKHSRSRIELMVKARSQFKERRYLLFKFYLFPNFMLALCWHALPSFSLPFCSTATNVEIEVPVPADSTNPNIRTSMGSAAYAPENDALVWKIKSFPGGKVFLSSFWKKMERNTNESGRITESFFYYP